MKAYLDYIDHESESNLSKTNLKNYLRIDNDIPKIPYCREERQFAAFLYNVFLEKKRRKNKVDGNIDNIVRCCLGVGEEEYKGLVITDVYFEATLMRDYFAICSDDEKEKFNQELLNYCLGKYGKKEVDKICLSRNLGQKEGKRALKEAFDPDSNLENNLKAVIDSSENASEEMRDDIRKKACIEIASMMMNATPDILVIYKDEKEKIYAKALECKYTSDEGRYHDVAGAEYPMQLFIQECIMGFCFGTKEKRNDSDGHQEIDAHIPRFPENSKIWKGKQELWEDICQKVYKDILNNNDRKCKQVINTGVELIRFETEINREENDKKKKLYEDEEKGAKDKNVEKEIFICVKDLMQVYSDAAQ